MHRASTCSINRIFVSANSPYYTKPLLNINFILKISALSSSSSSALQTIPDSHSISVSNPLYHFLPQTQNPNNIVNLICSSLKQGNAHLALLQNDIKELLPHLGAQEISRVLLRFQSDYSSALVFFNWVKNGLGLRPTTQNYCIVIHILACSKKFPQAMKLLWELIELVRDVSPKDDIFQNLVVCTEDCNWDPVIFDMLIKAYVKAGMIGDGFSTLKKTIRVGFIPSVIACNCLLNGLVKLNCIDQCWEVHEEMGRIGIHPNVYTFNILINVLCKDGDVDKVNAFLEKMEEEGFDPDIVTYNTLISSYCRKGRLEDAFYLYKIMYRRGVMPDMVSYTALMNGLCKQGKVREAHQIFHRMIDRGLDPDTVSYNTLISGYCHEGKMQESRSLLHEMIRNGICPDDFTCRIVIEGYGKEELRPFAAKSLLERSSKDGHLPGLDIYNKLIESLCENLYVAEALLLKAEMVRKNIKPDLITYRTLICCLCHISRTAEGESLMEEMAESGLAPNLEICRSLIKGYCKERDIDKAETLLGLFAKEFQVFDSESYNTLVKVFCEDGDMAKLLELQDRMMKVGFAPNSLTFKYVIHGLWRTARPDKDKLHVE
ncbi:PREDICTED: pentatricopeptide repeat-containing protein At5g40400 isoform X2 [Prunus mume]|uniref:Pentatricopeptide repeat-containing protein At5g40400 isoform X2 n=1 Tax=Prunus mume TaxID=102107 RepID=A0ABM1LNW0_PRUMU|nr:PREDICTED: pentatricopeptide repeat-containing protein At5g40400 isoform X2 [Prunus mume]